MPKNYKNIAKKNCSINNQAFCSFKINLLILWNPFELFNFYYVFKYFFENFEKWTSRYAFWMFLYQDFISHARIFWVIEKQFHGCSLNFFF